MIPIRDANPTHGRPWLTWALIGANITVWVYELALGAQLAPFIQRWGVIPSFLTAPVLSSWLTPVTSLFIHAGWIHLLMNMWFLWVFGDNVEETLGRTRFAGFYLMSGLAAVAAQVMVNPESEIPLIGASGAIAGILGGYVMLHPRAPVLTLIPPLLFVEVPAWVFLFVWFALQVGWGVTSLGGHGQPGGVAFFAHIGGFVAGLALALPVRLGSRDGERGQPEAAQRSERPALGRRAERL